MHPKPNGLVSFRNFILRFRSPCRMTVSLLRAAPEQVPRVNAYGSSIAPHCDETSSLQRRESPTFVELNPLPAVSLWFPSR